MSTDPFDTLRTFVTESGASGKYFSLAALEKIAPGKVSRLPVSLRIVLESVLRNCDGKKITEGHVRQLALWDANASRTDEIPFVVARVLLQDFTGVPLLCDLAAMRGAAQRMGKDPKVIEPWCRWTSSVITPFRSTTMVPGTRSTSTCRSSSSATQNATNS